MKNKYDSFKYWENLISENKTIRGHMFMDELPTEKMKDYADKMVDEFTLQLMEEGLL